MSTIDQYTVDETRATLRRRRLPWFLGVLAVLSGAASAHATQFQRVLWSGWDEEATSIEQTSDGGYIIVGNRIEAADRKIVLKKTDSNGLLQWSWVYGTANGQETAQSVRQTTDGGYIIAGETTAGGPGTGILLIKTNPVGALTWTYAYTGTPQTNYGGSVVRELAGGGYVVIGRLVGGGPGIMGGVLIRTNAAGALICGRVLYDALAGDLAFTSFNDVREDPEGTFTIVGFTNSTDAMPFEVLAVHLDLCGNYIWAKSYGDPNEHYAGEGLERLTIGNQAGNYVFTGSHYDGGFANPGSFLIRTDPVGNPLTHRVYPGFLDARSVRELITGQVLIAGKRQFASPEASILVLGGGSPTSMWYGSTNVDTFEEAIQTSDLGFAMVGASNSFTPPFGFYFVKTDAAGVSGCYEGPVDVVQEERTRVRVVDFQLRDVTWSDVPLQAVQQLTEQTPLCEDHDCCPPPMNMSLWLPFDQLNPGNNVVAGNNGVLFNGPTPINEHVGWGLCFDGANDYVQVNSYPAINVGLGDFSVDAWVKRAPNDNGVRVIVDKRRETGGVVRGYSFYLFNGMLGCQLADNIGAQFTNYSAGVAGTVPSDGQWHHVAVTVDRNNPTGGLFYLDGVPVGPAFDTSLRNGNLNNKYPLRVGSRSSSVSGIFLGCIDEVEVFRRVLTPAEILCIYNANTDGKCRQGCALAWDTPFCLNANTVTVTGYICNYTDTTQTYSYAFQGLPIGPGCQIAGPTNFTPPNGTVSVAPGQCAPVTVTIDKPVGMNTPGQVACYEMCVQQVGTSNTFCCHGSVQASPNWCVQFPWDLYTGLVGVPIEIGPISIENTGDPNGALDLRIRAIGPDMEPDMRVISLNGLPPGEPVLKSIMLPVGGMTSLDLTAEFLVPDPLLFSTILIDADLDGDGAFDPLASTMLTNEIPPSVRGDLNCDGTFDFGDINPFVKALSDPAGYEAAFPACDIQHADMNCDDAVDFVDINPFVRCIASGDCECP